MLRLKVALGGSRIEVSIDYTGRIPNNVELAEDCRLRRLIVIQGDTEPVGVEQQRRLGQPVGDGGPLQRERLRISVFT
jgi:hypothetical protein